MEFTDDNPISIRTIKKYRKRNRIMITVTVILLILLLCVLSLLLLRGSKQDKSPSKQIEQNSISSVTPATMKNNSGEYKIRVSTYIIYSDMCSKDEDQL